MPIELNVSRYRYSNSNFTHAHAYLLPALDSVLRRYQPASIFDLGCGNGSVANWLTSRGYQVSGADPSEQGIAAARANFPDLDLRLAAADQSLAETVGQFPAVISLEVVEHVYSPKEFAACLFSLVAPNGVAIVSTPYHGYLKNLAIALFGKSDSHYCPLWENGHIKFWSMRTLSRLLATAGFSRIEFIRVGRLPQFAKSMFAIAEKS